MPRTFPAVRGNFGSFEYWIITMKMGELIKSTTIPKDDTPGWEALSLEERYQRDIKINRVKKEIAPYYANDEDRFSSAIILAVQNHEKMTFESLRSLSASGKISLPQLYMSASENMGFLTFLGGEVFIPLDGQHRVKAFQYAISGIDDNGKPIARVKGDTNLANEDVAVILVRFEQEASRRIFNKVNRYAKPTGKGENLITDDDDAIAVITRAMISDSHHALIPARLVRYQSNTLSAVAPEFTTLATLYDANVEIAKSEPSSPKTKVQNAEGEEKDLYEQAILDVWGHLLNRVDLYREALLDTEESGDERRREIRKAELLGKPVGQLVLVLAFLEIKKRCYGISPEAICDRFNRIDWSLDHKHWEGVLMNPNRRVMSGKTVANMAARFVAHLCGASLTEAEQQRLREHIWGAGTGKPLPAPIA